MSWARKRRKYKRKSPFNNLKPYAQEYFLNLSIAELKLKEKEIEEAFKEIQKLDKETRKVRKKAEKKVFEFQKKAQKFKQETDKKNPMPKRFFLGMEIDISYKDLEKWKKERKEKLVLSLNKIKNFYRFDSGLTRGNVGEIIKAPVILHEYLEEILQISYRQSNILSKLVPYPHNLLMTLNLKEQDKNNPSFELNKLEKESSHIDGWRTPNFISLNTVDDLLLYSGEIEPIGREFGKEDEDGSNNFVRRWELYFSIRHFQLVLKAMPEIYAKRGDIERKDRVKKKNREKSAKLAAYEDKSRNVGVSVMKKMREELSTPFYCPYCLKKTQKKDVHVDHINPVSNGGLSVDSNLIPICKKCNILKKDLPLRIFCKNNGYDFLSICETLEKLGKFV